MVPLGYARLDAEFVRKSLVRILVTSQTLDYHAPWNPGRIGRSVGSGFIISETQILTNAHVVSNAKFIIVDKDGDPKKYAARVLHIAHDCDLAVLTVDDPAFFIGTNSLEFGPIPELHSTVTACGYPIGGQRMSVTRGVVSRVEFRTYSHSGLDSHLTIQIDAAINPGNSGGPVMQDGKVVGVAFQGYSGSVAQNTGYMIPTPVIGRFLDDIRDTTYDGYVELGVNYHNLLNPSYRARLKLPEGPGGVVVTTVLKAGSAYGVLEPGDVLLSIDGHPINADGHIRIGGKYVQLEEVVERKFHGDEVKFEIIRNNEKLERNVPLKGAWPFAIFARDYDRKPEFVLFAGLLFQPLSHNLLTAYKNTDLDLNHYYSRFVSDEIYRDHPEIIVLSAILRDPVNTHCEDLVNAMVDEVNGRKIKTLKDLANAFDRKPDRYVIKMIGKGKPIVLELNEVEIAQNNIKQRYGIVSEQFVE